MSDHLHCYGRTLNLIDHHLRLLPSSIVPSTKLGEGAQGKVFATDNPEKVVKVSILYDWNHDIDKDIKRIDKVYSYLLKNKDPLYSKIFEFGPVFSGTRTIVNGAEQRYVIYYSIQERLNPLSEEEDKIFDTISYTLGRWDNNYDLAKVKNSLIEQAKFLTFNLANALKFCDLYEDSVINHNDFWNKNVMKDNFGNYKLVDLDLASLKG